MTSQARKVLVISLDGATFDILNPLMAQGRMPNLRRVAENGLSTRLASVIPPVTPPAWTSFMTGKHPSKHGIFGFMHFDPKDYSWKVNNSQYIQSKTIWQILSEKGKRVVVVNLPMTYPPYQVNGVMVSGWDSVSSEFTYPPELAKQILETIPGYDSNLWLCPLMSAKSPREFNQFIDKLIQGARQSTTLALQLLETQSWDAFMIHFHQTDWIQHKLWPDIGRACDPKNTDARADRVRECYQRVDECVGTILSKAAPENPMVVILSDHGFGPHRGYIYPHYFLKSWGYLSTTGDENRDTLNPIKDLFRESRFAPLRGLYKTVVKARRAFDREETAEEYKQKYDSWVDLSNHNSMQRGRNIDWQKTRVAMVELYHCAFLYINVIGRGPLGIVEPGQQYENLVADLISRFSEFRHPKNGAKLLSLAARCTDVYPAVGPDVALPDIVLVPVDGYNFASDVADVAPEPTSEGIHHPSGVLFMEGVEVNRSLKNLQPTLVDIAPTILHSMGLQVPSDMDGRVLEEVFASPRHVSYEEVDNAVGVGEQIAYSPEHSELIEQRLKSLGYLE